MSLDPIDIQLAYHQLDVYKVLREYSQFVVGPKQAYDPAGRSTLRLDPRPRELLEHRVIYIYLYDDIRDRYL